jgi:hypothetical protein
MFFCDPIANNEQRVLRGKAQLKGELRERRPCIHQPPVSHNRVSREKMDPSLKEQVRRNCWLAVVGQDGRGPLLGRHVDPPPASNADKHAARDRQLGGRLHNILRVQLDSGVAQREFDGSRMGQHAARDSVGLQAQRTKRQAIGAHGCQKEYRSERKDQAWLHGGETGER